MEFGRSGTYKKQLSESWRPGNDDTIPSGDNYIYNQ